MNTPEELSSPNRNNHVEPYFDDLITEFDAKNSQLLMSYVGTIEHPGQKSMQVINDALEDTEVALLNIIRKVFHGDMGTVDERSSIMHQIFEGFINDRLKLFGEYAKLSTLSPEGKNEVRDQFISDVEESMLDSSEAFRDEIIEQFYGFIATDAKIIDTIIENDQSRNIVSSLKISNPKELAKIGAGVAIGMIVTRAFIRR